MIFARRALQRRLDELRATLDDDAVDKLVTRLNRPGKDRLAVMWEVALLHSLAKCGSLQSEAPLPSGRRPDISFDDGTLRFTADVTAVSDEGLDENNPYLELSNLITKAKAKLGLPIGGLDLRVKSKHHQTSRGTKTVLRLPSRKQLPAFVRDQIMPQLRDQMAAGEKLLRITIDNDEVGMEMTIDSRGSPYSSGGFAAYDVPTIKDGNPLYSALEAKSDQLRGTDGLAGVIVGDGDCAALAERLTNSYGVPAAAIANEFLRQYSSIDFVLLLTIREEPQRWPHTESPRRWVHPILAVRAGCQAEKHLAGLFRAMLAELPQPITVPANAALRAREPGYDLGHHGGYKMSGNKIRISSRELIEILAGLRTLDDNGAKYISASRSLPRQPNPVQAAFFRQLQQGRLPATISVIKTDENDSDDWVEFEFGDSDPAISPFT
jgi:hypothetical protein